jgi:hypothetical protein
MASGINSTLRQVGTATGVAALGSLLAMQSRSVIVAGLAGSPLASRAQALSDQISRGSIPSALAQVPPSARAHLAYTARAGFISGLNEILLIGAVLALAAAVLSFFLIRQRDFVSVHGAGPSPADPAVAAAAG